MYRLTVAGLRVNQTRNDVDAVALDGFVNLPPSRLGAAEVAAFDHVGFDGLGPALGLAQRREARGARGEPALPHLHVVGAHAIESHSFAEGLD